MVSIDENCNSTFHHFIFQDLSKSWLKGFSLLFQVSLAAQTLSNSVAKALDFMRLLGIEQFANSEGTSLLIIVIDQTFDVLNVRTPFGKGYKRPLSAENLHELKLFSESVESFICSLEDLHGNQIVKTRKSTGFVGFVFCLRSLIAVSQVILKDPSVKYVLSYKFS